MCVGVSVVYALFLITIVLMWTLSLSIKDVLFIYSYVRIGRLTKYSYNDTKN